MTKAKKLMIKNEFGDYVEKWVQISGGKISKGENKLGRKKMFGYSHKDYKEWGEQGGRPRKWESEAERKRAGRLRKKREKLGENVELRGYKKEKMPPPGASNI